jgi:hypothetical protein
MQSADHVLMIRPVRFISNPDTAASNAFQRAGADPLASQAAACAEFDAYVAALRAAGVGVTVVDDTPEPHTPDSLFPNNWVSFDRRGRVFLYPMEAPNRRLERRLAVLAEIEKQFVIDELVDLAPFAARSHYLEGTGSLVLDHEHAIAYVCHSSRSHPAVMQAFTERTGYRAHWFHALDRQGKPIYHTNVMLCVGAVLAVACLDALPDPHERRALQLSLETSGKHVIAIGIGQMEQFSGNMLELRAADGSPVFVMSRRAWTALTPGQRARIAGYARPVIAPVDTIERLGGGSARCMVAEIFLPKRAASFSAAA